MKKSVLLATFALVSLFTFAQRNIDWQTLSIDSPSAMRSTATGTVINLQAVLKNLGPDSITVADTVLFQFAITNLNPVLYYPGPNQNSFNIIRPTKTYKTGDTMIVTRALTTALVVTNTASANLRVISVVTGTGITDEGQATLANNAALKTVTWFNPQGFPLGKAEEFELAASTLKVYPNPVSDVLNFDIDYNKASAVNVLDITGKLIETVSFDLNKAQVNVSNYNKGIYLYQVMTTEGELLKAGKFNVN